MADAIDALGIQYPVLVLPGINRLPVSTYQKIEQYALHGGIVIATRSLPSTAPGFVNAESDSKQIQEISQRLFRDKGASGHFLEDESQLGTLVASYLKPDVVFSPKTPEIGFNHRQLSDGDLYFIANTSNQPQSRRREIPSIRPICRVVGPIHRPNFAGRESGQDRTLVAAL